MSRSRGALSNYKKVVLGKDSDDLKEDIGSMLGEESSMLQNLFNCLTKF